jgi:hypothetical protein
VNHAWIFHANTGARTKEAKWWARLFHDLHLLAPSSRFLNTSPCLLRSEDGSANALSQMELHK